MIMDLTQVSYLNCQSFSGSLPLYALSTERISDVIVYILSFQVKAHLWFDLHAAFQRDLLDLKAKKWEGEAWY